MFPNATAVAEVHLPGFTPPGRPGNAAVSVRIVRGIFRLGQAWLRSPDGEMRMVTLYGIAPLPSGLVEAFLGGVTTHDLKPGQYLIQEADTTVDPSLQQPEAV